MVEECEWQQGMRELTEKERQEYFHRSYTAVDGLWFMKIEEQLGFEAALKIDEAVWRILPKIQARTLKGMMGLESGLADLQAALSERLEMEGFKFEMRQKEDVLEVTVSRCPWNQIMIKCGRGHLSEQVSNVICWVENEAWANEFSGGDGGEIGFVREARLCREEERCRLLFGRKRQREDRCREE